MQICSINTALLTAEVARLIRSLTFKSLEAAVIFNRLGNMCMLQLLGLSFFVLHVASQTVRLAGDSTMAVGGGGGGTQGLFPANGEMA